MRFGKTLRSSIYEPWKANYIDYAKLKSLLREHETSGSSKETESWTEEDEARFVEELVNVQLEKVNSFHANTHKRLQDDVTECGKKLNDVRIQEGEENDRQAQKQVVEGSEEVLNSVLAELDRIATEINELEKYSRLNFTGFLKAGKKHDRRRGSRYKVRPLVQVRLAALPFNSEDYSPLLYQ